MKTRLTLEKMQEKSIRFLCPFHKEKTASFVIRKKDSRFQCFGCGRSGKAVVSILCVEDK